MVIDPITSIVSVSGVYGVKSMLTRLVDFLKVQQITAIFTNLTLGKKCEEKAEEGVSSLMDTWILRVFRDADGVISTAANRLGIPRTTLNAKLKRVGISRSDL